MRLDSRIYRLIRNKYHHLYYPFGGIDTFLEVLVDKYQDDLLTQEILTELITTEPTNLHVVTPEYILVNLENMLIEGGYEVYDINNKLLYRVGDSSTWGQAYLDKLLFISSDSGSIYKIKYKTFNGFNVYKLVINRFEPIVGTRAYFDIYSKEVYESNKREELNSLLLNKIDIVVPSITVYQIESELNSLVTRDGIRNNPSASIEVIDTELGEIINVIPKSNHFLLIEDNQQRPMYITTVVGEGVENLLDLGNGIYYIAIGENVTINTLKSLLGVGKNSSDYKYIKLIGNIVYG